jgi:ligand-binding SRPBCC domain-containing protein
MKCHRLTRTQLVPGPMSEVFGFFEDPKNLEAITPPWLHFRVQSSTTPAVRLGTEIEYRLTWRVFPMRWVSRISEYGQGRMFADEMLSGPYAQWYHRHYFSEVPRGVRVVDVVEYRLPVGPLGRLVHSVTVRRQLEAIFDFRRQAIERIFAPLSVSATDGPPRPHSLAGLAHHGDIEDHQDGEVPHQVRHECGRKAVRTRT